MVSAPERVIPAATAADLATECRDCSAVVEPHRIAHKGGPVAWAHYICPRCGCQQTAAWCWIEDWP
ncbi:MAG TPA: hypothetical protein VGH27_01670 [Streptosporangiaceae bacterium]|jgi:hypothetical protein